MYALMKNNRAKGAQLTQVPIPTIGSEDVLIQVKASSICGTDLHIYNWDEWAAKRVNPPALLVMS